MAMAGCSSPWSYLGIAGCYRLAPLNASMVGLLVGSWVGRPILHLHWWVCPSQQRHFGSCCCHVCPSRSGLVLRWPHKTGTTWSSVSSPSWVAWDFVRSALAQHYYAQALTYTVMEAFDTFCFWCNLSRQQGIWALGRRLLPNACGSSPGSLLFSGISLRHQDWVRAHLRSQLRPREWGGQYGCAVHSAGTSMFVIHMEPILWPRWMSRSSLAMGYMEAGMAGSLEQWSSVSPEPAYHCSCPKCWWSKFCTNRYSRATQAEAVWVHPCNSQCPHTVAKWEGMWSARQNTSWSSTRAISCRRLSHCRDPGNKAQEGMQS